MDEATKLREQAARRREKVLGTRTARAGLVGGDFDTEAAAAAAGPPDMLEEESSSTTTENKAILKDVIFWSTMPLGAMAGWAQAELAMGHKNSPLDRPYFLWFTILQVVLGLLHDGLGARLLNTRPSPGSGLLSAAIHHGPTAIALGKFFLTITKNTCTFLLVYQIFFWIFSI